MQIHTSHPSSSNLLLTLMVMSREEDRFVLGSVELQRYCPASDGLIGVVKFPTTTANPKLPPAIKKHTVPSLIHFMGTVTCAVTDLMCSICCSIDL